MFSDTEQVSHQVCQFFFVSSVCLLVRVTLLNKNKAVVCCLLATSAIMLSEKKKIKRKMWSEKWYLKRSISCDADLLNELLETNVPWDDAIVVSAGKLRKMWDSLSELRSCLCERRLERTVVRPPLLPVKTAQFTPFFPSGIMSHCKVAQFNWECTGRWMPKAGLMVFFVIKICPPIFQPVHPFVHLFVCHVVCVCVCVCVFVCTM